MTEPWVELKDVSFTYNNTHTPALKNLDVTIHRGEKVLVLGANGSGKSTFLRLLKNELDENEGNLLGKVEYYPCKTKTVDGKVILDKLEKAEGIKNSLPQDISLAQWQRLFHLNLSDKAIHYLSKGEREIYRIAKAMNPIDSVFIFDEPLQKLSPHMAHSFVDVLDDFHIITKATIIVGEHHLEEMMYRPIDRVLVFSDGRIVFDGKIQELLRQGLVMAMGIREPFYLTVLRYAGYPLQQLENIENVNYIYGTDLKSRLTHWTNVIPRFVYHKPTDTQLTIQDVTYRYPNDETKGLFHLSIDIKRGEMISIIGGNGAGKTTLGKLCTALLSPQKGKIFWNNTEINPSNIEILEKQTAFVSHNMSVLEAQNNVQSYFDTILDDIGVEDSKERQNRIQTALEIMALSFVQTTPINQLSGSQKRRLMLAGALVKQPQLIVVAEPTEGQDYVHFREMMYYLYQINTEYKITVIVTTHDVDAMLEFTNRAIVLEKGRLIADTKPISVVMKPQLMKRAALQESSIVKLANRLDLADPYTFIQKFVNYNREINRP